MPLAHAKRVDGPRYGDGLDKSLPFIVAPQREAPAELILAEDVIITPELYNRVPRAVDLPAELAAWKHLSRFIPAEPPLMFSQLAEVLVRACHADSAGITLEERRGLLGELETASVAGQLAPLRDQVPRHSPSGTVIARQRAELFARPDLFYTSLQHETLRFEEMLVVPWQLRSGQRGAVWITSHSPNRRFDSEDLRLIETLASLADLAMRHSDSEERRRSHQALASAVRLANELAHEINNPLQALINSLHLISLPNPSEHLVQARAQATRLAKLVQPLLQVKRRGHLEPDDPNP